MINNWIVGLLQYMPIDLVWIFSMRYIAGKELKDAVSVTQRLNRIGAKATMDLLGEFQTRAEKVESYKQEYLHLIEESASKNLDNSFSVKPTMFGLLLNEEACYQNIREIVSKAASYGRFVRIDMEDSQCTDKEIAIYKRLLQEFRGNVGLVIQAYLKRTLDDLKGLAEFGNGSGLINLRLCKGIYNEPETLAYKNKKEINDNFIEALDFMFQHKMYAAIATHDKKLIRSAFDKIKEYHINRNQCEFQMLYGVTPELRKSIIDKGFVMRVYVPYGKDWFNYSTRRLKENPRMVGHILKALFVRG